MGAHDLSDMDRLARLALNPQGVSRGEIYLAVASLYRLQGGGWNDHERALVHDILRRITKDVDVATRIALAKRLAADASAPHDLILLLADDVIDVARPLLLQSPLLHDADLLRLVAGCGVDHHAVIAERPNLSEAITDVLSRSDTGFVLVALVQNATARISVQAFAALREKSAQFAELREPLACRLATMAIEPAMAGQSSPRAPAAEGAQKLIDKLADSGQLKAGFLLRVLNQGQTDLFDLALAKLVNMPVFELRSRFYRGGPRAVALACRGVGIDRCVFPTVFKLSRQAHNMHANLSHTELAEVDKVFASVAKSSALSELSSLTFN